MADGQVKEIWIGAVCVAATAAMGFLLVVLFVRYFFHPFRRDVLALCPPESRGRKQKSQDAKGVLAFVGPAFAVSRLFVFVSGVLILMLCRGTGDLFTPWIRWDAAHYVRLARDWYVSQGDARFHLVFFPLYPMLIRGLHLLTGMDCAPAGVLLSNACLFGAAWALYRLTELGYGQPCARDAVLLLLFSPFGFFFSLPFSESLFLMLSLASALCARKRRFVPAVLLGALCAATRLLGLLSAVPIFYEGLKRTGEKKGGLKMAIIFFLGTLPVTLGFASYLYLNHRVSGHPLTFLTYQKEHWFQQMGSLPNTLRYTLENALNARDPWLRLGTWIPQALFILLTIALLLSLFRRVDPGDGAYALLYIYLAVSPTWLLSGCRYLTALYPLTPMLGLRFPGRRAQAVLLGLGVLGGLVMLYLYLVPSCVM